MLSKAELQRLASREKVALGVLEKDYVLTEALNHLYLATGFKDLMVFKGGTALRKIYYPDWRYSEDLDFTLKSDMAREELNNYLNSWYQSILESAGISLSNDTLHKPDGYARVRVQFIGPLNYPGKIFMDLTFDEPLCLEPVYCPLITNPFPLESHLVLTHPLEELIAEKIRSLIERGKSRDYYDVWKMFKEHKADINMELLADVFSKKLKHKKIILKSVDDFFPPDIKLVEAYWSKELGHQLKNAPDISNVFQELRSYLDDFVNISRL
jgi:predicted nucleotidyltransferase component of viral defense system